jgi:hypothetical protein
VGPEDQRFVGQREHLLHDARPQRLRRGRSRLVGAGVDHEQIAAEEPVAPQEAQAALGVPGRREHPQVLVAEHQDAAVGAGRAVLDEGRAERVEHLRLVRAARLVLVGAQHPAQAQPVLVEHRGEHRHVVAPRVDQHRFGGLPVGEQVAHRARGLVVQEPEVHGVRPARHASRSSPITIRVSLR